MASRADYSVYLVTDRGLSKARDTLSIVRAGTAGGVTCVQLREKQCSTREFVEQALSIREFLRSRGIPLIINDRLDVAQAVRADGVHLGQKDMPLKLARQIAGDSMIIGVSAESLEDAIAAENGGADYIGISPVFATSTKTDTAPAFGLEGVREMRDAVEIPLVGIGGIHAENAGAVIRSGADGVAVVSAIVSADDPHSAAGQLRKIVENARKR